MRVESRFDLPGNCGNVQGVYESMEEGPAARGSLFCFDQLVGSLTIRLVLR